MRRVCHFSPYNHQRGQSGGHLTPIASSTRDQAVPTKEVVKSQPSGAGQRADSQAVLRRDHTAHHARPGWVGRPARMVSCVSLNHPQLSHGCSWRKAHASCSACRGTWLRGEWAHLAVVMTWVGVEGSTRRVLGSSIQPLRNVQFLCDRYERLFWLTLVDLLTSKCLVYISLLPA